MCLCVYGQLDTSVQLGDLNVVLLLISLLTLTPTLKHTVFHIHLELQKAFLTAVKPNEWKDKSH